MSNTIPTQDSQNQRAEFRSSLKRLGVSIEPHAIAIGRHWIQGTGSELVVRSPIDGSELAKFDTASAEQVGPAVSAATDAFREWRLVPAPRRGEFVRRIGQRLRRHRDDLARVVSWEAGKTTQEAIGEVQEMIDVCDFAVGLSRQLYGVSMGSERPEHRLTEYWHPLGPVGVITAFNFPVAVWAWNAMLALVCGDPVVWKPSERTPLCALACHSLAQSVAAEFDDVPDAVLSLLIGSGEEVGQSIVDSPGLPLISATGSVPMGRLVAQRVAARLGRSLLELGGNNGMIVTPSADLELAVRSIVFSAAGTCGQRCTTLRRLIVHESIRPTLLARLQQTYARLPIGNPLDEGVLVGPLISEGSFQAMQSALADAKVQGGRVHFGERVTDGVPVGGFYVQPALVEISSAAAIIRDETFAPILYVMGYETFDEAVAIHNNVPQGLASAILTSDIREAERFCSAAGSDCGIVNVNVGPSGAEIGGAFGGEKDTGGGRESGSDSWKNYMRRVTSTVNYSTDLPLAQGVRFDIS